jgi:hypothetical protein
VKIADLSFFDLPGMWQAAANIARVMRDQYPIGYVPENPHSSGKRNSIKVKVTSGNATAWARSGSYAK